MHKRILSFALALLLIFSFIGCSPSDDSSDSSSEDTPASDFTVYDKDGNPVKLSDKRGTPIVLNFWASWCSPCKREMPEFDETAKEFEGRVEFMMVNLTDGITETLDEAKAFIKSEGYSFPVYFDTDSDAATTYGIMSIPTTYFIDAEGNIKAYVTGMINADTLKQGISMIYTEISDK